MIMEINKIEGKDIIDYLVSKFSKIINLARFKSQINEWVANEYKGGLEVAGIKFDMNFVSNDRELNFLQDYVFNNLEQNTDQIGNDIRQEISRGLLNGETTEVLKKRVKSIFKENKYSNRLKTVLRTEGQRASEAGTYQGAMQSGLDLFKYLDVLEDKNTSEICNKMDTKYGAKHKAIPVDEEFSVIVKGDTIHAQTPPFHPYCRTVTRYARKEDIEQKASLDRLAKIKKDLQNKAHETKAMIMQVEKKENEVKSNVDQEIKEKELEILERKSRVLDKLEADINE